MLTFPQLSSGVIAQYPLRTTKAYSSQVLTFLDGSEQRYRISPPLHRWEIQLDLLGDSELNELAIFFADAQGSFDFFSFTDPFTATIYPSCYLEADDNIWLYQGEFRGKTSLVIREAQGTQE